MKSGALLGILPLLAACKPASNAVSSTVTSCLAEKISINTSIGKVPKGFSCGAYLGTTASQNSNADLSTTGSQNASALCRQWESDCEFLYSSNESRVASPLAGLATDVVQCVEAHIAADKKTIMPGGQMYLQPNFTCGPGVTQWDAQHQCAAYIFDCKTTLNFKANASGQIAAPDGSLVDIKVAYTPGSACSVRTDEQWNAACTVVQKIGTNQVYLLGSLNQCLDQAAFSAGLDCRGDMMNQEKCAALEAPCYQQPAVPGDFGSIQLPVSSMTQ